MGRRQGHQWPIQQRQQSWRAMLLPSVCRVVGFRVILSHLPQRPTAPLLSHALMLLGLLTGTPGLCEKTARCVVTPEPASFERRNQTEHPNPWSCWCFAWHLLPQAQAMLNIKPAWVSQRGEVWWSVLWRLWDCPFVPFCIAQNRWEENSLWLFSEHKLVNSWSSSCFYSFSLCM